MSRLGNELNRKLMGSSVAASLARALRRNSSCSSPASRPIEGPSNGKASNGPAARLSSCMHLPAHHNPGLFCKACRPRLPVDAVAFGPPPHRLGAPFAPLPRSEPGTRPITSTAFRNPGSGSVGCRLVARAFLPPRFLSFCHSSAPAARLLLACRGHFPCFSLRIPRQSTTKHGHRFTAEAAAAFTRKVLAGGRMREQQSRWR